MFSEKGAKKNILKRVIEEYEKNIKLSKSEKEALYYFIKQRILSLIRWSKAHGKGKGEWFDNKIRDYQNFKRISFQEFNNLIV